MFVFVVGRSAVIVPEDVTRDRGRETAVIVAVMGKSRVRDRVSCS